MFAKARVGWEINVFYVENSERGGLTAGYDR
jgi:hypothetical protein